MERYAIQVEFLVDVDKGDGEEKALQILKDHLALTYSGQYNDIQDIKRVNLMDGECRMLPLTEGVVIPMLYPQRTLPAPAVPPELLEPHFEGSRFDDIANDQPHPFQELT